MALGHDEPHTASQAAAQLLGPWVLLCSDRAKELIETWVQVLSSNRSNWRRASDAMPGIASGWMARRRPSTRPQENLQLHSNTYSCCGHAVLHLAYKAVGAEIVRKAVEGVLEHAGQCVVFMPRFGFHRCVVLACQATMPACWLMATQAFPHVNRRDGSESSKSSSGVFRRAGVPLDFLKRLFTEGLARPTP